MTVIAWDGKTLAADKLCDSSGQRRTTTKIKRAQGHLLGASGNAAQCRELMAWWELGRAPEKLPKFQEGDNFVDMVVITPDGQILKYERSAWPIIFEDRQFAMGAGRDYAMAAMHLGATARAAVEVACQFETSCGGGIDTLELIE